MVYLRPQIVACQNKDLALNHISSCVASRKHWCFCAEVRGRMKTIPITEQLSLHSLIAARETAMSPLTRYEEQLLHQMLFLGPNKMGKKQIATRGRCHSILAVKN